MHDGQNLFDPNTSAFGVAWMVQNTLDQLIYEGKINEILVIGPYNKDQYRINEYTQSHDQQYGGGEGNKYLDFLEQTLIPKIQKLYRINLDANKPGILGSSLGGLISC